MDKRIFQALFSGFLILLSVFAIAMPANAATDVSSTMTVSPAALPTSGTNAQAITVTVVSATQLGPAPNTGAYQLKLPTGWSWTSTGAGPTCPNGINFSPAGYLACDTFTPGVLTVMWDNSSTVASGTTFTATIPAGLVNLGSGRQFEVNLKTGLATTADQGFISIGDSASSQTVTFNANGGSGMMNPQTASTSTALTTNAFTKDGYTFGGWATSQANATAGTVAYADGASYPFTSSETLYAIWTANGSGGDSGGSGASSGSDSLAATGFDAAVSLGVACMLVLAGAVLALTPRRFAK